MKQVLSEVLRPAASPLYINQQALRPAARAIYHLGERKGGRSPQSLFLLCPEYG